MAHTGIFATKAECDAMAGENIDATGYTEANINMWCLEAESYLNCLMKYNASDTWAATLNVDKKYILSEYVARYVGACAIMYNMAGFTTRIEAEDMLNFHAWRMRAIEKLMADQPTVTFLKL